MRSGHVSWFILCSGLKTQVLPDLRSHSERVVSVTPQFSSTENQRRSKPHERPNPDTMYMGIFFPGEIATRHKGRIFHKSAAFVQHGSKLSNSPSHQIRCYELMGSLVNCGSTPSA
ncbi:hypothetical protein HBI12_234250 [Parastagonospora nodorum]|nr:hypothetical protein HBI12_234250 [Parastagonospora nodorum]